MAGPVVQTADAKARITLPAAFAESTVIVETVSPSEVRVRKVGEGVEQGAGTDDLMKLAEVSGVFDFWNAPAEDIYGPDDGEPA
jgi:hypothetical protein